MQGIKRAALNLTAKASPHAELGMVVYEQKCYHDALLKMISSRTNVMSAMLKWVAKEENFAIKDVYARMAELEWMWSKVMHDYCIQNANYRKTFKTLIGEERAVDEYRKSFATCRAKADQTRKQAEKYSKQKRGDSTKLKTIDAELAAAYGREEEAGAVFERRQMQLEKQKASMIREAAVMYTNSCQEIAEKMVEIFKAQGELADLIPIIPTQHSKTRVYHGPEKSEQIVKQLTAKLGLENMPNMTTDPAYSSVYQTWDDQPNEPAPTSLFYTPQPELDTSSPGSPVPPPRPVESVTNASQDNIGNNDDDSGSDSDAYTEPNVFVPGLVAASRVPSSKSSSAPPPPRPHSTPGVAMTSKSKPGGGSPRFKQGSNSTSTKDEYMSFEQETDAENIYQEIPFYDNT